MNFSCCFVTSIQTINIVYVSAKWIWMRALHLLRHFGCFCVVCLVCNKYEKQTFYELISGLIKNRMISNILRQNEHIKFNQLHWIYMHALLWKPFESFVSILSKIMHGKFSIIICIKWIQKHLRSWYLRKMLRHSHQVHRYSNRFRHIWHCIPFAS